MAGEGAIRAAAGAVVHPDLGRTLDELGMVRAVEERRRGRVRVTVGIIVPGSEQRPLLADRVRAAVAALDDVAEVDVDFVEVPDEERLATAARIRGSAERGVLVGASGSKTRIITISSGKGGVGKSSVTANLAVALAGAGRRVGVIDADVWGFSIPRMLGIDRNPAVFGDMLVPPAAHGVRAISMEYFVPPNEAVIWRGPMLHKALEQFLADVFWDDPEFLLIDMPPGTGDVAISISQFLPRAQAIVVTTPQITAQRVAKRAALMAGKVDQEVMGIVENMSWFTGDDGVRYHIFGEGGGRALADDLGVPLLGRIPLLPALRVGADEGRPIAATEPESEAGRAFADLAAAVIERRPRVRTHPELVIR